MRDVMTDLETCGVRAGCAILSIGAVVFDHTQDKLGKEFYQVIKLQSCIDAGLHIYQPTMDWWKQQSPEARKVLTLAEGKSKKVLPLLDSLDKFNEFLKQFKSPKVYGNGADFDNAILISAYHSVGLKQGWGNYSGGCYRTLKRDVMPDVKMDERVGTYHNALDDAKNQALHQMKIMRRLDEMKELWAKNQK